MQHAKTPLAPTSVFVRMASMETEKQPVMRWVGVHNETIYFKTALLRFKIPRLFTLSCPYVN